MKQELIKELFDKFESCRYETEGIEYWSARDLQPVLGYAQWKNFQNVIDKAKKSAENAGINLSDHFADIGKMVSLGSGSERELKIML